MRPISHFRMHGRCSAGRTEIRQHRGDIYRPDGLPAWTLNYTAAGVGRIEAGGRRRLTRVGDLALFRPQLFNDFGIEDHTSHWVHLWSVFQPEDSWMSLLSWPEILPGVPGLHVADSEVRARIEAAFAALIASSQGPWPNRDEISLSILRSILLWAGTANPQSQRSALDPRVGEAMRLCCAEPAQPWGVEELADRVGLSPSRFAHLFRAQVGLGPIAFLEQQRIYRACDLLLMTAQGIAAIAAEVGYNDPSYFGRVFRKHTHQTPRAYRLGAKPKKRD